MKQKKKKQSKLIVIEKNINEKSIEKYFFNYAFPCAQVKVKIGSLSSEEYEELKEIFVQGGCPCRSSLENLFPPAFRRIKNLAEKCGKDTWDEEVIKEYWSTNHNEVIDQGDGMYGIASEDFKDLCKIHIAKVEKVGKGNLTVKYGDKKRIVSSFLVPDAKIGDKVTIHFAHTIEKVN